MVELDPVGTVSVTESAELLGMSGEEAYDLVFRGKLRTVEARSGRRVVPLDELEAWKQLHAAKTESV